MARAVLRSDHFLGLILSRQLDLGYRRHVIRRVAEEGRRGRTGGRRSVEGKKMLMYCWYMLKSLCYHNARKGLFVIERGPTKNSDSIYWNVQGQNTLIRYKALSSLSSDVYIKKNIPLLSILLRTVSLLCLVSLEENTLLLNGSIFLKHNKF